MSESFRRWAVCLLPQVVAGWVWCFCEQNGIRMGSWAPHIFGRMIGVEGVRKLN